MIDLNRDENSKQANKCSARSLSLIGPYRFDEVWRSLTLDRGLIEAAF
jgi:hypothetical protein